MLPISLTLKGLYSYQKEQTIDFTELTGAHLFGIFGAVGSGKSAILEAISFALYDDTERLNLKGDNRNYNMMNLKSSELLIRFSFKAGPASKEEYLFEVSGKRAKGKFDTVRSFDRRQFKKEGDEWRPIEVTGEDIIGLSYKNFRRTIIIPQGKFQEFLQMGKTDRTRMLKEIFNLERFELYHKTARLKSLNDANIHELNGQLSELEAVDSGVIKAHEAELKSTRAALEKSEKSFAKKTELEQKFAKTKELFQEVEDRQLQVAALKQQEAEILAREAQLKQYRVAMMDFNDLLQRRTDIEMQIESLTEGISENQRQSEEEQQALKAAKASFKAAEKQYKSRETLKQKANELDAIYQLQTRAKDEKALKATCETLQAAVKAMKKETDTLNKENDRLKKKIRALRKKTADSAEIIAIEKWYATDAALTEKIAETKEEILLLEAELEDFESGKAAIIEDLPFNIGNIKKKPLQEVIKTLAKNRDAFEEELVSVNAEVQQLQVEGELEHLAESLMDGAPCPLCGATDHPRVLAATHAGELIEARQVEKNTLQANIQAATDGLRQLQRMADQAQDRQQRLQKLNNRLKQTDKSHAAHRETFSWEAFSAEDRRPFEAALKSHDQTKTEREDLESQQEKTEEALQQTRTEQEQQQKALSEAEKSLTTLTAELSHLRKEIKLLDPADFHITDADDLEEKKEMLLSQFRQIEAAYQDAESAQQRHKQSLDILKGERVAQEKQIKMLEQSLKKTSASLKEKLSKSDFENLAKIEEILEQELDFEQEQQEIAEFNQEFAAAKQQLIALTKEAKGQTYAANEHQALQESLETLKDEISGIQRELGRLQTIIDRLKSDLKRQRSLKKDLEKLERRKKNIAVLSGMFRSSGFVNFVSGIFLRDLSGAANKRFQHLTRRQLQLEVTEDNDFQVRDFLNEGKVRSVKTLSGGQTFQAALCLALALADNVQQLSKAEQNFFFIDEGFGTLDKSSLQIVFETLKALRKENRIVGVISHVEELQQEIDIALNVYNDEENGSLVETSW